MHLEQVTRILLHKCQDEHQQLWWLYNHGSRIHCWEVGAWVQWLHYSPSFSGLQRDYHRMHYISCACAAIIACGSPGWLSHQLKLPHAMIFFSYCIPFIHLSLLTVATGEALLSIAEPSFMPVLIVLLDNVWPVFFFLCVLQWSCILGSWIFPFIFG